MSANDDVSAGEVSDAEIREAVGAALPDADLSEVAPVEEGKNTVFVVTVEPDSAPGPEFDPDPDFDSATRELVLKVGDHHFAAGCRAEPHLLELVAERTRIPVPEVVDTGEFEVGPYFLAERVPGASQTADPDSLAPEAFERVCAAAGHNLGALHDAFPADKWGMLGLEPGADELHFAREFADWPTYFEAWLTHNVERLEDTRFSDLRPELAERATEMADELRELGPFDPVLTHGDYRLDNLVVDPETGETNAVLDWATPVAATPVWEIAVTEAILVDRPAFDADRKRELTERLYEAYRRTTDRALAGEDFEARRRRCRFGARLRLMVNLDEEMAGRPDAAVDARAREHRAALREFGVE